MNKKNGRKVSIIVILAIVALVGYLIIDSIKLGMNNSDLSDQYNNLSEAESIQNEKNSEKENMLLDENESKYLEDLAREEYDYIYSDERVYADTAN
ncbi:MAG: hypothetical protein IJA87_07265 [Clostridia bacterium]|nr:hypothetical protein [Clostridia bacterium]